jgi:hypothetical protein
MLPTLQCLAKTIFELKFGGSCGSSVALTCLTMVRSWKLNAYLRFLWATLFLPTFEHASDSDWGTLYRISETAEETALLHVKPKEILS